eukprot:SAG31_NODE_12731_length_921_cov_0.686131_2_plen_115_part_00
MDWGAALGRPGASNDDDDAVARCLRLYCRCFSSSEPAVLGGSGDAVAQPMTAGYCNRVFKVWGGCGEARAVVKVFSALAKARQEPCALRADRRAGEMGALLSRTNPKFGTVTSL